jgi:hypothetical protein
MFLLPLVITSHSSKVRRTSYLSLLRSAPRSRSSSSSGHGFSQRCEFVLLLELLKEYRKLDDEVTMRINRTTAQFRDRDRMGATGKGSVQQQACAYLWQELVGMCARDANPNITRSFDFTFSANWKRRAEIIDYCVKVLGEEARAAQSDHDHYRDRDRPGASVEHPPLSGGVTNEVKARILFGSTWIEL